MKWQVMRYLIGSTQLDVLIVSFRLTNNITMLFNKHKRDIKWHTSRVLDVQNGLHVFWKVLLKERTCPNGK